MSDLKPCPCCGSDNIIPPPKHWPDGCVYCRNCGLRGSSPEAWNTRTDAFKAGMLASAEIAEGFSRMMDKPDHTDAPKLAGRAIRDAAERGGAS